MCRYQPRQDRQHVPSNNPIWVIFTSKAQMQEVQAPSHKSSAVPRCLALVIGAANLRQVPRDGMPRAGTRRSASALPLVIEFPMALCDVKLPAQIRYFVDTYAMSPQLSLLNKRMLRPGASRPFHRPRGSGFAMQQGFSDIGKPLTGVASVQPAPSSTNINQPLQDRTKASESNRYLHGDCKISIDSQNVAVINNTDNNIRTR